MNSEKGLEFFNYPQIFKNFEDSRNSQVLLSQKLNISHINTKFNIYYLISDEIPYLGQLQ